MHPVWAVSGQFLKCAEVDFLSLLLLVLCSVHLQLRYLLPFPKSSCAFMAGSDSTGEWFMLSAAEEDWESRVGDPDTGWL